MAKRPRKMSYIDSEDEWGLYFEDAQTEPGSSTKKKKRDLLVLRF